MPEAYIVFFSSTRSLVQNLLRRPPTKIMELCFRSDGSCYYVGLACANGARYR